MNMKWTTTRLVLALAFAAPLLAYAPIAQALRQPRPLFAVAVAGPGQATIDYQLPPFPTPDPGYLPSLVELRSDLDGDGELETLHDADTVAPDGDFSLASLPGFVGSAVVTDSDPAAQSSADLQCSEPAPGQFDCHWQP